MLWLEELGDPVSDLDACLLKTFLISCSGSVQLGAVATVLAFREDGDLTTFGMGLLLGSPLPWILTAVGKEDFVSGDAHSTLVDCVSESSWSLLLLAEGESFECSLTKSGPVWQAQVW